MDKLNIKETWLSARYTSTVCLIGVLTAYFFIFLLSEHIINDHAVIVLGSSHVVANYSIGIIFTGLGFLAFALSRRVFAGDVQRRGVLGVSGFVYMGSISAVIFLASPSLFTVITCICTLSMGYMGGFVHYHAAVALQGKSYTGRVVGVSYSSAIILQYVVQYSAVMGMALVFCVTAGMVLLFAIILMPPRDWLFENPLPYESTPTATYRELWLTAVIVALMSALAGIYDGAITGLHAAGKLNLTGWPRLLLGIGALFAGVCYDIRKRVYMPIFSLCAILIMATSIVFLYTASTLSMVLQYFSAGFYVAYFIVSFLDLAPRTSNPALWAGMGRVSRSFFIGLTAAPSGLLFSAADQSTVVTVNAFVFIIILVLFWLKGDLIPAKPVMSEDLDNKKATLKNFAAKYQLTPRETEIFEKILVSDKVAKELALDINISERVLYRYFNSLYEKTGTNSRLGLFVLYYGGKEPPQDEGE